MIPENDGLIADFTYEEPPSRTFFIDTESKRIWGFCDGRDAVAQSIWMILNTLRYKWIIYSWDYGVELADLRGKQTSYVTAVIKSRITDALLRDTRINSIEDFKAEVKNRTEVHCSFVAKTIFGDVDYSGVVIYV